MEILSALWRKNERGCGVMATDWKSQQSEEDYHLQFQTDDKEKYKLVEKAAQMAVDGKPTADVVEVVRCRDCRCWEEIGFDPITEYTFGYCRHYQWQDEENSRETNGQDYCSYGRKE